MVKHVFQAQSYGKVLQVSMPSGVKPATAMGGCPVAPQLHPLNASQLPASFEPGSKETSPAFYLFISKHLLTAFLSRGIQSGLRCK